MFEILKCNCQNKGVVLMERQLLGVSSRFGYPIASTLVALGSAWMLSASHLLSFMAEWQFAL